MNKGYANEYMKRYSNSFIIKENQHKKCDTVFHQQTDKNQKKNRSNPLW